VSAEPDAAVPALVTLDVWRVPTRAVPRALTRMALDRRALRRVPGLRFAKLLGTSEGTGAAAGFAAGDADLRRWALLATWSGRDAADAFAADAVPRGWRRLAEEHWRVELTPLAAHGRWSRRAPFGTPAPSRWDGPTAAITRARLAPRRAATFWRAIGPVAADLRGRDGLLTAFGIGEAPLGWQGTFSAWRDAAALRAFAYDGDAHRDAIARTGETAWYAEELFARFAVRASAGTLDGSDPLA
jgi:hypothetical protein